MHAKNRIERSELKPADEQFAIFRVVRIAGDKSADVRRPIRQPGNRIVQSRRNLLLEEYPVGVYVSGPSRSGIALRPGKRGARKDKHALLIRFAALPLIDALCGHQRKRIRVSRTVPEIRFVGHQNICLAILGLRLGCVQPPGINANFEKRVVHQIPIVFSRVGIKRIIQSHPRRMKGLHFCPINEKSALVHVVVGFRSGTKVRPHRNHQVKIVLVKIVHHSGRIGIARLIEHRLAHGVPPEPVLHDVVGGNTELAVFVRNSKQLFLCVVFVFALPETVGPLAVKRSRAG